MVNERIRQLRALMKERSIDIYYIPTADFHESEYVGAHFKARQYLTGFTGSAGVAVITQKEAGLWTDGRYFIQAAAQLASSEVTLYRMGEEGVPTVKEYMRMELPENGCIGFDGRVVNTADGAEFEKIAKEKSGTLEVSEDLAGMIWKDRPALSAEPAFLLDECYSGETAVSKLKRIRSVMEEKGADIHIVTSLDDIGWTLNVRGNDVLHFPIVLSFLAIEEKRAVWFVNPAVLNEEIRTAMAACDVTIAAYEEIYAYAASIDPGKVVLLDRQKVNFRITNALSCKVISAVNPALSMKAVKNPVELENLRKAHLQDGIACTRFMYWLKKNIGVIPITELSASDYLQKLREQGEEFLDLSFGTISAYGANAAMMHYSATKEHNAELKPEGFLLVDSGGHYRTGSTDITRTTALGPLTQEMKEQFTRVLRGNLALANAKFLYGCSGLNLDILARGPLWEVGLDYKCGTGHGVGYLLNIHEAPNGFRWKHVPERNDGAVLEEGMVTTDEPGVYLEGNYGIRTENELICHKGEKNEYGQYMYFENMTYAPIDLDAVLPEEMTGREKQMLNDYHKMVFQKISPYLNEEETLWLKEYTREI